jgi:hypothetical protein
MYVINQAANKDVTEWWRHRQALALPYAACRDPSACRPQPESPRIRLGHHVPLAARDLGACPRTRSFCVKGDDTAVFDRDHRAAMCYVLALSAARLPVDFGAALIARSWLCKTSAMAASGP